MSLSGKTLEVGWNMLEFTVLKNLIEKFDHVHCRYYEKEVKAWLDVRLVFMNSN